MSPFGQTSGALLFENFAGVQMALVVKKVMDRGMDEGKFLEDACVPELGHRFFPPGSWRTGSQ